MHDASGRASEPSCIDHRSGSTQGPDSLHESHMIQHRHPIRSHFGLRSLSFSLLPLLLSFSLALLLAACAPSSSGTTAGHDATLRQIATEYAQTNDLAQAQTALDKLNLANPGQLLLSLAEADLSAGGAREEIEANARLAAVLGARSQKLAAYLTPAPVAPAQQAAVASPAPTVLAATLEVPTVPAPTDVPASPTPPPPTVAPTATDVPPTATDVPPTSSPTPEPQNPRVLADSDVNLRGGPGKAYGVVGRLRGGQETPIIGRNASGDWWQVEVTGVKQAWVAGTVVRVLGAIDTVAVAKNIPPVPTAAPQPTAKPPVATGPDFRVIEKRLWSVQEIGGWFDGPSVHCGEKRELHVRVVDAAGNPLNGVTVLGNLSHVEAVTGHKGVPGDAEFVLGGGDEVTIIRDVDGRTATSDYVGGLTTTSTDIPRDALIAGGFCVEDGTCDAFLKSWGCKGHHSWTVTFRRSY